jgi:choline dehydrogenase-like flavoprotein
MKFKNLHTDVLIIGSGPGGSVIADRLKDTNHEILLLEKGFDANDDETVKDNIYEPIFKYYNNGGATPVLSKPIFPFAEANVLGGGSEINGGLIWKTPTHILDTWLSNKSISQELYDNVDKYYSKIKNQLNVNFHSSRLSGNNDSRIIDRAAKQSGFLSVNVPKAIVNCRMHNRCSSICPSSQKKSLSQTLLKGIRGKVKILSGYKILKLVREENKIIFCFAKNIKTNKIYKIFSNFYFVSSGAINTPFLLTKSNIVKTNKSLMFHHNLRFIVDFKKNINANHGTMFNKQIQEFIEDRFLIMASNYRKSFLASALESKIEELDSRIERFRDHALYTTQVQSFGKGSIKSFLSFGPFITYKFDDKDLKLMKLAIKTTINLLFKANAKQVILPLKKNYLISSYDEYIKNVHENIKIEDLELLSVHAMSSIPMGYGDECPVNHYGKIKHLDNIYVSDASILPSNIGESPQGTIMIFSNYIADKFIEKFCK